MTEVRLGGGGVAAWGKHSEILMLPTETEITEGEAGQRINASPAAKGLRSLFRTLPAPPCSKQFVNRFLNTKRKKIPRPGPDLHE